MNIEFHTQISDSVHFNKIYRYISNANDKRMIKI